MAIANNLQLMSYSEVLEMASMLDALYKDEPISVADPETAMKRLQDRHRDPDFKSALDKKRGRYYGAAPTVNELTKAEAEALASAERDYRIASVVPGKPREDIGYDGRYITPSLPPASGPHALQFLISIAKEPDPFIRKELARQARLEIMHNKSTYSKAYYDEGDFDHKQVIANVSELYKLENDK